jgi:hypothetical protein
MMDLRLKFPPEPEYAPYLADVIVGTAKRVSSLNLDYSPATLRIVDQELSEFESQGVSAEDIAETLFYFGCYVGEVFVRNLGAQWVRTAESPMAGLTPWPIVVVMPNGDHWNPIGKVFRRLSDGQGESVSYLYDIARGGRRVPQ